MSAFRTVALATACVAGLSSSALAGGHAVPMDGVVVAMDNVTVVAFKNPVSTVYIGNPSIAEVTMIDAKHAFVLGKRFGATNLIALRADKSVAVNDPVLVSARFGGAVTIYRGAQTYNYACSTGHCETRPVPGDPSIFFQNTEQAAAAHEDAGNKGAAASPTNGK